MAHDPKEEEEEEKDREDGKKKRRGADDHAFAPPVLPPQLLPKVVTQVIPEVIVTAKRIPAIVRGSNIGTLLGVVGGTLIAGVLRDVSQARLDAAYRQFKATANRPNKDSPIKTISQPADEVLPEIVVTAAMPVRLPMPQFFSVDADPFEMQTVFPRTFDDLASPAVAPDVEIAPVTAPQIAPFEIPIPVSMPLAQPFARPFAMPLGAPLAQPFADPVAEPFAKPLAVPAPVSVPVNLTTPQGVGLPFAQPQPFPQPMPAPNQAARCPPCTKSKKKRKKDDYRTECFRQLVKQAADPDNDTTYNWAQIDCITGKEI